MYAYFQPQKLKSIISISYKPKMQGGVGLFGPPGDIVKILHIVF